MNRKERVGAAARVTAATALGLGFVALEAQRNSLAIALLASVPTVALILLCVLAPRGRSRRAIVLRTVLGILLGYLLGFALVEAAISFIYARQLSPRADIPMIRSLVQLSLGPGGGIIGLATNAATVLVFALPLGVGVLLARWLAHTPHATQRRRAIAMGGLAASVIMVVLGRFAPAPIQLPTTLIERSISSWARPTEPAFRDIAGAAPAEGSGTGSTDAAAATTTVASAAPIYALPGIKDHDLYVFAIEAYGYAAITNPEIGPVIEPVLRDFGRILEESGYTVASSYLRSPVAGGFSWLAEATFLSGQWVDSQTVFQTFYDQSLPTLTGFLHSHGYHTFTVRPGTVHGPWPEAWDFYRFEKALIAYDGDFSYVGPWFSYVPITDQFALWSGHQYIDAAINDEGVSVDRPMASYFQLVSSHTPFNRIPPLIDDWSDLGDGSVYIERGAEIQTFDNTWTGGTQLIEGYTAALTYVFAVLGKYVDELIDTERDSIIVVFGDHQAQRPIREQDAHLSVPIHIATTDPDVLQGFIDRGFRRGMISAESPPHRPMSEFFPLFVEVAQEER